MDYARTKAIAILASTAIIFTPSVFAFSFSNWFSSDKTAQSAPSTKTTQPTQLAQAEQTTAQPAATPTPAPNASPVTTQPQKHKKYKKHKKHYHHKKAQPVMQKSVATPIVVTPLPPKNEMTLMGGLTISSLSNGNQSVAINSTVTNTYNTSNATNVNGMGGVSYDRLFHLHHNLVITVGPGLYYTNMDEVNGTEHPFSNAGNFDTLNYHYAADTWSLMAQSKLIYEKYQWQPFITGGIGPSWNRLYSYGEVPTDPSGSASANPSVFKGNTQAEFAYEVGCGVKRIFYIDEKHNVHYDATLSYQYMNFGEGQLSAASISTTGQAIKVSTLDTNVIVFALGAAF